MLLHLGTTTLAATVFLASAASAQLPAPHDIEGGCATASAEIGLMVSLGKVVVFTATDGHHGKEPWVTDGTSVGTHLLADLAPGEQSSSMAHMQAMDSHAYFFANKTQLWKTNGTARGTSLVKELKVTEYRPIVEVTVFDNHLVFVARKFDSSYEMWKSDGTTAGTRQLTQGIIKYPTFIHEFNGDYLMPGQDEEHGIELWKIDGRTGQAALVKDIVPGIVGSMPHRPIEYKSELYFWTWGIDGSNGWLWKTDGSPEGTQSVLTPENTPPGFRLSAQTMGRHKWFLAATSDETGPEVWTIDGTSDGLQPVADISPLSDDFVVTDIYPYVEDVVFFSRLPILALWSSDGTPPGTKQLGMIHKQTEAMYGHVLAVAGKRIYLDVFRGSFQPREIWMTDGTNEGTHAIGEYDPSGEPGFLSAALIGNRLLFRSRTQATGSELWITNGSAAGTILVRDINETTVGCTEDPRFN